MADKNFQNDIYWKYRISERIKRIKEDFKLDFNEVADMCEHLNLPPAKIIDAMNMTLISLSKLDETIQKLKPKTND